MEFVESIIQVFTTTFTSFVGPLATAIVDLFKGLFVETVGSGETAVTQLTVLGQGLLVFAAIGMLISGLYMVYGIFRARSRKSL